jgi:hypothetical protein
LLPLLFTQGLYASTLTPISVVSGCFFYQPDMSLAISHNTPRISYLLTDGRSYKRSRLEVYHRAYFKIVL